MAGGIIMVIVLLIAPVAILISGAVGAALFGAALNKEVDERHGDSELRQLWSPNA